MKRLNILTATAVLSCAVAAAFVTASYLPEVSAQAVTSTLPKLKASDPLPANLFVELARAVNPAVVNVFTTYMPHARGYGRDLYQDPYLEFFEQFMGPQRDRPAAPQQSLGTGFIIREDGLIVTNNHVIDKADIIKVQVTEDVKQIFDAKVIGKDARTDIALIKIDAKRKLPFAKLGSSSEVQVGEWVAAFGNPYGYGHTMTKGIISAIGREIDELNLNPFMQTDASINPGNSGGPLVNTQGLVIGVNTAIDARAQGIGFVIPIDNVKSILPQLEKEGGIDRGIIGVQMVEVDEESAKALNLKQTEGALIMQVLPGSPAEKAGLQPYDLVTEFAGKKITDTRDLAKAVAGTPGGKTVDMKIVRNAKPRSVQVKVASGSESNKIIAGLGDRGRQSREKVKGLEAPYHLGFMVADYSNAVADIYNLPRLKQARPIVLKVQNGSEADRAGLAPGDIILDINRTPAHKAKDALKKLKHGSMNILRVLKQDRVVLISLKA
jgi:serine protease Do